MKFSVRDLLLVTVIVAILTAWGIDHWRQAASFGELKEYILKDEAGHFGQGNRPLPVLPAQVQKLLND